MKKNFRLYLIVFLGFFVLGIPSFAQEVEAIVRENINAGEASIVNIFTNVNGAEVYVNNVYKGFSPLTLDSMIPGVYGITIKKDGMQEKEVVVDLRAGTETNLYFELDSITGFLRIKSNINGADVFLDGELIAQGSSLDTGLLKVLEGTHEVKIQKFGWQTKSELINVFENFISEVTFDVEKALFSITAFSASPKRFNPQAPSDLGLVHFNYTVTTPGSAIFEILDNNENIVYSKIIPQFDSRNQIVTWNGKNTFEEVLPEGAYTARLTATPFDGWYVLENNSVVGNDVESVLTTTVAIIDNSIFYPIVGANSTGSSIGIANPRLMPVGTTLFSVNGVSDFSANSGFKAVPFSLSFVATPLSWMELSIRAGIEAQQSSDLPMFFGASAKFSKQMQNAYFGGLVRYSYVNGKTLVPSLVEPGLGFGLLAGFEVENFLFSLTEEAVFGSETGNVGSFNGHLKTGFGLQFQRGIFSSEIWISLYSPFTTNSMAFFEMVESGFDVLFLLPNTTLYPSIGGSYVYERNNNHSIAVRFGVNILIL